MKNGHTIQIIIFLLLFVFTGLTTKIYGQITKISDLSFGEFYPTSGGYININTSGTVSSSGVVYLGGASNAQFSIRTTGKGRDITITIMNPVVQLTRLGGGQMRLTVGPVFPNSYRHPGGNNTRIVRVGGHLEVGNIFSNPPGSYNGIFQITVNNF